MKNLFYITLVLFITNCSFNKVENHHGIHFLKKKANKLVILQTNKNDIFDIMGPPSTKSSFNNDIWIYIERKTSKASVLRLGEEKTTVNNVLILEIDTKGLLVKKNFYDKDSMKKLEFSKNYTKSTLEQNSFVYNFLSSMRQKINDPLGKRKK